MKVRLIKKATIVNYSINNAQSRIGLEEWLSKIRSADWKNPERILLEFGSADLLGNGTNRVYQVM